MLTKKHLDDLTFQIIGSSIEVHKIMGRGLLESVYHKCIIEELIHSVCKKTPTSSLFSQRIQVIYTSKRPKFVVSKASNLTFSYQTLSFLADTT
jgi:GxxExxY protein